MIKKDLIEKPKEMLLKEQENAWWYEIGSTQVSIVKWTKKIFNGAYEIYSSEELFEDIEVYDTIEKVLKRLMELKVKNVKV